MKKKTLVWVFVAVVALIAILLVGKKAGWFGKSGDFKEVEVAQISAIDIVETVAATGKYSLRLKWLFLQKFRERL